VAPFSRRTFLVGSASAVALAACGGDDKSESASDQTVSSSTMAGGLAIAKVFSPTQPVGVPVRLPLALADSQGALLDEVPARIKVRYSMVDSTDVSPPLDVTRHADGIPTPYFPLVATFTGAGTWKIAVEADGAQAETTVTTVAPDQLPAVPRVGDKLISMKTPTKASHLGVDPICTRKPACPFHGVSLDDAMKTGKAVAFMVSTPAFCQTAICGPVLELLIDRHEDLAGSVEFVHAEVYTDSTAKATTQAVQTYGLTFEPALFLALPDGTIQSTLGYTFDGTELDGELARIVQ
jgi:hypothetical protein